jgi:hypothetical protein
MKTQDLISRLAADRPIGRPPPGRTLAVAVAAACLIAAASMLLSVGLRPDFTDALQSWRFVFKFVVTLTLAGSGFVLLRRAVYPGGLEHVPWWMVFAAPAVLLAGVGAELLSLPQGEWAAAAIGANWLYCLTLVPSFGLVPLAIGLWAIRQGATTRPVLSGFLCGLLSGGIAATAYAAHCPDDSPLFVLIWYPAGILGLGIIGALLGRQVLRW